MENVLQKENHQMVMTNIVEGSPYPKNFEIVFIDSSSISANTIWLKRIKSLKHNLHTWTNIVSTRFPRR